MASSFVRDCFQPTSVNSPLMMVCTTSLLFNSVKDGVLRPANMHSNLAIMLVLGVSNGCYIRSENVELGAKLGILGSVLFSLGPKVKLLYTRRLFPPYVHYGIGLGYLSYHALSLYQSEHFFEDAGEDDKDETF